MSAEDYVDFRDFDHDYDRRQRTRGKSGRMNFEDTCTIEDVAVRRETTLALLCVIDGEEHWIPKSQIDDDSEVYEMGTEGKLVVSQWIADQRGIG